MGNVPAAKPSPRTEYGILKWYEGDTFCIQLNLTAKDPGGHEVALTAEDTAAINFYDCTRRKVTTMEFADLSAGFVTLDFPEDVSGKFTKGRYTYDVVLNHENITTVANNNRILVE